ncbi:MAG: hypothetical protein ACD_40C00291G0006 [uncultured bacterium]|uniref:Uncharacterized protein n=1 Tax=Candidatus Collierbacteria bacterium GW2011_GWC2_44_18 TaxID=1618392 RepID=A0A0G1K0F4_9BACT|nr:MAG: hypothetical protein ACD_40C00291G0006 [uncultured bacterium]KKT49592.1 MAG: hypothetical protein UW41_C0004G0013 [Candidatus Collierbacteria bacterium GW2011_GWC2_44_18]
MPKEFKYLLVAIVIEVAVLSAVGMFADQNRLPKDFKPGDSVLILTGQTIIQDGKPCQENKAGFISPTSKTGRNKWYAPDHLLWPTKQLISIIFTDGTIKWQYKEVVVKSPADAALLLCPIPAN